MLILSTIIYNESINIIFKSQVKIIVSLRDKLVSTHIQLVKFKSIIFKL